MPSIPSEAIASEAIPSGAIPPETIRLELGDIQGMALRAYRFPFGLHHFLKIGDAGAARAWLTRVAAQVTSVGAIDHDPDRATNVCLSWQGMAALGMPPESLQSFPEAFRQGMAARAKAGKLGDTGDSAPDRWDSPLGSQDIHVLVSLSAASADILAEADRDLREGLREAGSPVIIHTEAAALLPGPDGKLQPVEHFGYRDGISQPSIEGSGLPFIPGQGAVESDGSWRPLRAGEFVLGYPDEFNRVARTPSPTQLARNGTFLVLRKLHQDVARFRTFLLDRAADDPARERLAAKMMGRWRGGAPVAISPDRDDPALADDASRNNDFTYAGDRKGRACPLGAHIRRMNPRAGLTGPAAGDVNRHRVLRQGLPYGTRLPPDTTADDGLPRGAIIILINADIANQFEFVQRVWMNDGNFALLSGEKDPLIGNNDGTGSFKIPHDGRIETIKTMRNFVSTRGGEYFFMPGIQALRHLP
jgi:Dyp-type peroxidase family